MHGGTSSFRIWYASFETMCPIYPIPLRHKVRHDNSFVCQNYITNSIFCLCIKTHRNKRKYSKREKETMVNEGDALKYFAALEKSKYACRLISRFWSLVFQGGHVWWRIVDGILINKHLNCWCHLSCTMLYAQWLNDQLKRLDFISWHMGSIYFMSLTTQ